MKKPNILLVEDERDLAEILQYNLEREGFDVVHCADGQDGLRRAQSLLPDLIILDLMLPVFDGLEVCRELRSDPRTQHLRILMLTARGEEVDEIVGFSMGADDYVLKPFKTKPLIHRIKALLRRTPANGQQSDQLASGGVTIDRVNHMCTIDGKEVGLTPTEFRLLWTLIRQPGRPFSRNELMDTCRGEDANALERTIDVHIRSLRQKLNQKADYVETVRGIGYRFRPGNGNG
ncbi:response regulator [Stratiformator vulcanicus]|uniref:Alkaline phosphatase synthesis transcriptional regulatory protein PhoP n=1 Tax=Stratiformator vulcanicus TaxID=2527980 RepID=A0A517QZS0_9PLAN|nr:response regulator [Stratiformator vulcanicus]QDT37139.1 Alkaline phosphatase synthesis transcriptional regulatory protein PhoP [Stratiformator vulcanicus]